MDPELDPPFDPGAELPADLMLLAAPPPALLPPPPPQPQQYPTLSSGYTQQLQREAARCQVQRVLQQLNCCPEKPIKIQTNSGARTLDIQKCYTFTPVPSATTNLCGVPVGPPTGKLPGGGPSSRYTQELIDRQYIFNPNTRFDQYKPYVYPTLPSTIIFTSPTVPVPVVNACLLPGVNVSGPNPISAVPTDVTVVSEAGGYIIVTWTPGNDRSIVKYNIYVNNLLYTPNVVTTTYTIGPFPKFSTGTVQIEPVAQNNWRGPRSAIVNWLADL